MQQGPNLKAHKMRYLFRFFPFLTLLLYVELSYGQMYTAELFMGGIRGKVMFTQNDAAGNIVITPPVSGNLYSWSIHQFPVDYDRAERCTETALGNSLYSGNSVSPADTQIVPNADLSNPGMLFGRSFVLMEQGKPLACATILPMGEKKTVRARFFSKIGGEVIFRQGPNSYATLIYTDLFHTVNMSHAANYSWEIRSNPVGSFMDVNKMCLNLGDVFNVGGEPSGNCSRTSPEACNTGDLSHKLGMLNVGPSKSTQRMLLLHGNLPLVGENTAVGKSLVILSPNGSVLACATVEALTAKHTKAVFSSDGVSGKITFSQISPYDPTTVDVDLMGLGGNAGGYHVHNFPVPPRTYLNQSLCGGDYVSGHWNPFKWDIKQSPDNGTSDQFEVGDLSGKFGSLNNVHELNESYVDWNLPLFGKNSIIGRSIVIHRNDDSGSRWVCANIEYPSNVRTAVAVFKFPVIGRIMFRQDESDPMADTSIFVELNHADGLEKTSNHTWHVHVDPVGDDFDSNITRCSSVGGHYNPFNVYLEGNYSTDCSPSSPLRCEIGDVVNKHSKLDIISSKTISTKYFFTDTSLPLSGPLSIVGRSIVIHGDQSSGSRLACASIFEMKPIEASVMFNSESVVGSMHFSQSTSFDWSDFKIDVKRLQDLAGGYHVHEFPVLPDVENPCSGASVGGHFNPFSIDIKGSPVLGNGTLDMYEVGDLSGKFGRLTNMTEFASEFTDNNLGLHGIQSIMGRSVVIHKEIENARWVCGNILEKTSNHHGMMYKAKATFRSENIQGFIMLSQVNYQDGYEGDTQVHIKVDSNSGDKSEGHTWHIYNSSVPMNGPCPVESHHYNPYHASMTMYDECNPLNPRRCEVGDLSGKHGNYTINGGQAFYTDLNLPLAGKHTVYGRSIIIHSATGGSLGCADILPFEGDQVHMTVSQPRKQFDKLKFRQTIADLIKSPDWMVNVEVHLSDTVSDDDCLKLTTYITGRDSGQYMNELQRYLDKEPARLGVYAPCLGSASSLMISFSVLCLGVVLTWLIR